MFLQGIAVTPQCPVAASASPPKPQELMKRKDSQELVLVRVVMAIGKNWRTATLWGPIAQMTSKQRHAFIPVPGNMKNMSQEAVTKRHVVSESSSEDVSYQDTPQASRWCNSSSQWCSTSSQWCSTSSQWCSTSGHGGSSSSQWCSSSSQGCSSSSQGCSTTSHGCSTSSQGYTEGCVLCAWYTVPLVLQLWTPGALWGVQSRLFTCVENATHHGDGSLADQHHECPYPLAELQLALVYGVPDEGTAAGPHATYD
ncbi:hypothetical protein HaLaN_31892 [Haematococcus lacustris]|uniref:Uncharacterized protein n=1 Tax=Haematococcus lacustris TaxID=44745 RepID=A0A6A0AK29_HAELA|nr:hypothetical protein HaLaN_31892 [Haematococcus lacustris]